MDQNIKQVQFNGKIPRLINQTLLVLPSGHSRLPKSRLKKILVLTRAQPETLKLLSQVGRFANYNQASIVIQHFTNTKLSLEAIRRDPLESHFLSICARILEERKVDGTIRLVPDDRNEFRSLKFQVDQESIDVIAASSNFSFDKRLPDHYLSYEVGGLVSNLGIPLLITYGQKPTRRKGYDFSRLKGKMKQNKLLKIIADNFIPKQITNERHQKTL